MISKYYKEQYIITTTNFHHTGINLLKKDNHPLLDKYIPCHFKQEELEKDLDVWGY